MAADKSSLAAAAIAGAAGSMMKKTKKDGQPVRDERIQYSRGTHDEDHKILLNGKPVRTYRCANEENSARIILNGKPYSVYRRSENDRNVTFLNGIPYRGGEIPWVMKQEEWKNTDASRRERPGLMPASSGTKRAGVFLLIVFAVISIMAGLLSPGSELWEVIRSFLSL
jgi:hypothetical protein